LTGQAGFCAGGRMAKVRGLYWKRPKRFQRLTLQYPLRALTSRLALI
jgi:hypothetical protein